MVDVKPTEILLIEDDPRDMELTIHALTRANVANNVEVARDGEEALEYIFCTGAYASRNIENGPKLILLDLKLPKVDGMEVLERIKAHPRTRSIPVVVLSSSREEVDLVRAYELGVNSYIVKPVDFEQFASAVSEIGLYWVLLNNTPGA